MLHKTSKEDSSTLMAESYVLTDKSQGDVQYNCMITSMSAQAAEEKITALRGAILHKHFKFATLYISEAWEYELLCTNLTTTYPNLARDIERGFDAGVSAISCTFTSANNESVNKFAIYFHKIIKVEFRKGQYLGPFSRKQVEEVLGPFQSSPLSIIPKPHKPGKFRIVQNLSHPHSPLPSSAICLVNSAINSVLFPCTWGMFKSVYLLISRLSSGSQVTICDVREVYCTILIRPEQWPGIIVRFRDPNSFTINTMDCFGLGSGCRCYSIIGNTKTQIFRARGMGPILK